MKHEDEVTVSDAVSEYIALYGQATLQSKIAHVIDGLKCVARRILWTIGSNETPRRVSAITGSVLEKYHPSGDLSISEAIARLAQPYNNIVPLIESDTNVGMYGGGKASAPRYLDVYSARFTRDVFFNGIDKEVYRYVPTEYGTDVEPAYLIPKIPMALLTGDFGMAIGHKTELAMMEFNSVCELVKRYIDLRVKYGADSIPNSILFKETAELLVPDFPVFGLLRNRSQLIKEYTKGNFDHVVITDGVMEIHQNSICISSLPWGVAPGKVDKELGAYMVAKLNSTTPKSILSKVETMHHYFSEVGEHSTGDIEASLEFTLRRGVSAFSALDKLKELTHFHGRFNPNTLLLGIDGICNYMSPLNILEIWYNERVKSILNELKIVQKRYHKKSRELEAQIIIIDHTDEVTKISQSSEDATEATIKLAKRFKLTEAQARFIMTLRMADITKRGKDDLVNEKEKIGEHLQSMKNKFNSIDNAIYQEVEELQSRYSKQCPRKCRFPDFIGAVKVKDEGYVQVRSIEEIDKFMVRFDKNDIDVTLYPSGPKNKFVLTQTSILDESVLDHPREFIARDLIVTRFKPKFTIIQHDDGATSRLQGIHLPTDNSKATYIGDQFLQIDGDGNVSERPSSDIVLRKTSAAKGGRQDILYVSDLVAPEVIVVYCNSRESNSFRVSRVTVGSGKIMKLSIGKTEILGVYRPDSKFIVSVPNKYLNRCGIRHVLMDGKCIAPDSKIKVDLGKKSIDDGRKLSNINKRSHIYSF